jgi:hypothetical protein
MNGCRIDLNWKGMDDNTAAMVAGHMFTKLTGVKVDNQHCSGYDHEEQTWVGVINEYFWTVEKYDNEYLVSFSDLITHITPRAAARPPRLVHMHQLAHGAQRHSVPERSLAA